VDQLGHDEESVRIGGILALLRISDDSSRDRLRVMSVLAAYIRQQARWDPQSTPPDRPERESVDDYLRRLRSYPRTPLVFRPH
jgi:hypothetical protein